MRGLNINKNHYILYIATGSLLFSLSGFLMLNLLHPFTIDSANADSKSTAVSLRIGESIMVPEVSTDSINIELDPTAANGDFKTASVTVGVSTNRTAGYTLTASVEGSETALTNADYDNYEIAALSSKTSADDFADLSKTASMNKWGYATDNNGDGDGQTEAGYYYAMPDIDNPTTLKITDGPAATSETEVTFATKGKDLAAGKYENTVVFTAVGNIEPEPAEACDGKAYTICYEANDADGGEMDDQTTIDGTEDGFNTAIDASNASSVTLRAQNFWRSSYGFSGWNTKADGTGTQYGPMETIDMSEYSTDGLTLYANWIASAGEFVSDSGTVWTGCSSLSTGDMTALTDVRNGQTYAVAKLGDNKCWMVENLRLGGASAVTLDTTTSVTSGDIVASSTSWGISATTKYHNYNNISTSLTASPNTNDNSSSWYGYGSYYSWPQAVMYTSSGSSGTRSLCPKGWTLPSGNTSGQFKALNDAVNSGSTSVSMGLRAYPANFVYSGDWSSSSAYNRGTGGYYWSSTVLNSSTAYHLYFNATNVSPGTGSTLKYYGRTVRCLIGS